MPTYLKALLLLFYAMLLFPPADAAAQAQARLQGSSLDDAPEKLKAGKLPSGLAALGYTLADGVVFIPSASFETGYAYNPDEFFNRIESSPYGLSEANAVLGFVRASGATTFAVRGNLLQYDEDIARNTRWDAGAAIDNAYTIAPGLQATFGLYHLRDEINLTPSDGTGGYSQLSFTAKDFEAFGRVRADQISYLTDQPFAFFVPASLQPFLRSSQFNVRRVEGVTGFIIAPQAKIGFYVEAGGGSLDYFTQNVERLLDRDAAELWGLTGLRFNLHETLRLETGWRYNQRDFEDASRREFSSSYFDGRLVWSPVPEFQLVLNTDRKIVEPITAFALAGDQISYGLVAAYKPAPLWDVSVYAGYQTLDQIGDDAEYREWRGGLYAGYQFSERTTLYGVADYEHTEEVFSGEDFEKYRFGAGTKVKF
jgi:hypothetical protein